MPLWRSQQQNVYHICQRCGVRQPLGRMKWQNGILVCDANNCDDTAVVGVRDMNVARAIAVDRKEMLPDRKLVDPTDRKVDQDDILY
jgi:hypothetical protein